jgi:ferric-dicitrate binding protein FerR (iron transport regulator)
VFAGEAKAAAARHDAAMQAAWTNAACGRSKKLPKLESLLSDRPATKRRTPWQSMLAAATMWAASAGEIRTEKDAA